MDTGFTNVKSGRKDRYYELWQKTPDARWITVW